MSRFMSVYQPATEVFADIAAFGVVMLPLMIWSYWSYLNDPETKKAAKKDKLKALLEQYQKEHPVDVNERRLVLTDVSGLFMKYYPKDMEPKSVDVSYAGEWFDKSTWYNGNSNVIDFGFTASQYHGVPGETDGMSSSERKILVGKFHASLQKCITSTNSDLDKKYGSKYHVFSQELNKEFDKYAPKGDGDEGALILVDVARAKACAKWIRYQLRKGK